jgi:hypothetical protein
MYYWEEKIGVLTSKDFTSTSPGCKGEKGAPQHTGLLNESAHARFLNNIGMFSAERTPKQQQPT